MGRKNEYLRVNDRKGENCPSLFLKHHYRNDGDNPGHVEKLDMCTLLSVSLSFLLYKKNVETAESIGPKFCVGPHMTPRKVCGGTKLQKFVFKSF